MDWQLTTDDNGKFQMVIPRRTLEENIYKLTASFAGDSYYTSASGEVSFYVMKDYGVYSLNLTGTPVISSGDTDTITATLLRDSSPVSDVVLDYEIKHGATTISTGTTSATDANGQATISYTGTGIGDVDVIVSMAGMSLQETFVVQDTIYYNSNTITGTVTESISLPNGDFEITWKLKRQNTTRSSSYCVLSDGTSDFYIGQVFNDGRVCFWKVTNGNYEQQNSTAVTPLNTEILMTYKCQNGIHTLNDGSNTYTLSDFSINTLQNTVRFVSGGEYNYIKELKIKAL